MRYSINRRTCTVLVFLLTALLLAGTYFTRYYKRPPYELYERLKIQEVEDSMAVIDSSAAVSTMQRYIRFHQLQGAGFNNQAQEILLYDHLALLLGRTYVYQPFWYQPRRQFLPLSAFLLGPTRASISEVLFDAVCPVPRHVAVRGDWEKVVNTLKALDDDCVVVDNWILNWTFLAQANTIKSIWPSYKQYLAHEFSWPSHISTLIDSTMSQLSLTASSPYLAIHFRRGDFSSHCAYLSSLHSTFTTWSHVLPPSSVSSPALDASNVEDHCYPSLQRIYHIVLSHARDNMKTVHFLHDGAWDHPLVYQQMYKLEQALLSSTRFERITHSGMITESPADFRVAVDMEIARKAKVFIGNGFSSLSSQIVALRLADGGDANDIVLL